MSAYRSRSAWRGRTAPWSGSMSIVFGSRPCATASTPRANSGPTSLRPSTCAIPPIRPTELGATEGPYPADPADLAGCSCFILTVPPPIDANRQPDLGALRRACRTVGSALRPGGIVVVESTVYPGVTEEVCGPLLAAASRLWQGGDFQLGSPAERINPRAREPRPETISEGIGAEG